MDVSCENLTWLQHLCGQRGIHLAGLVRHMPYTATHLSDTHEFISWDCFSDLVTASSTYFNKTDFTQAGRDSWQTRPMSVYADVGAVLLNTLDQFLAVYGEFGFLTRQFPLESKVTQINTHEVQVDIRMLPGQPGCESFFHYLAGQMEFLPLQLSEGPARVITKASSFAANYNVYRQNLPWQKRASRQVSRFDLARELGIMQMAYEEQRRINRSQRAGPDVAHNDLSHGRPTDDPESKDFICLAEASLDAIISFNQNLKVAYANRQALFLLQYSANEIADLSLDEIMPLSMADNEVKQLSNLDNTSSLINPDSKRISASLVRKDHATLAVEVSSIDHMLYGNPSRTLIIHNTTQANRLGAELDHLRNQLYQMQKSQTVGQLSGGIAHDFNNLLVAIKGYAELLATDHPHDYLQEVIKAAARGTELTKALLSFNRATAKIRKVCNLADLINALLPMLRRLIPSSIELKFNQTHETVYVTVNPSQLEQIIVNLCVNARDAMPAGGSLTIEIGCDAGQVQIYCRDTGSGISEAMQAKIFEPLFTTKSENKGTGLGLSIVRDLVGAQDGVLTLNSTPGQGSEFIITLPRSAAPPSAAPAQNTLALAEGNASILLVEDNQQVRELSKLILTSAGYQVTDVVDGISAVDAYRRRPNKFDLVLMDVVLPHLGGEETAQRIISFDPDATIMFMSGYGRDSGILEFLDSADYAYIEKPFTRTELRQAVAQAIDEKLSPGNL